MMAQEAHRIWIVVPAYNEEPAIGNVLKSLRKKYSQVVVVDDGSQDKTSFIAKIHTDHVLKHKHNMGQGAALRTGFDYALNQGADVVVTFDADGQMKTEDIEILYREMLQKKCDVVLGTRFAGRLPVNMPSLRKLIIKLGVIYFRWALNMNITDTHNGFRIFTKDAIEKLSLVKNKMAHADEILIQIHKKNLSYSESPVEITYTAYSLNKGQRTSNFLNIIREWAWHD